MNHRERYHQIRQTYGDIETLDRNEATLDQALADIRFLIDYVQARAREAVLTRHEGQEAQ